jgi:hypothetical protein
VVQALAAAAVVVLMALVVLAVLEAVGFEEREFRNH